MKVEQEHIVTIKRDFITLKELNHPNIIRYKALYVEQEKRTAYLVMEYVSFPSFDKIKLRDEE